MGKEGGWGRKDVGEIFVLLGSWIDDNGVCSKSARSNLRRISIWDEDKRCGMCGAIVGLKDKLDKSKKITS